MKNVRNFFKYILTFSATMLFLMGLLLLSATIPKSSIKQNVLDSAKYLCDGKLFGEKVDGIDGSRIDRYADSILLGILYQYDSEHPLTSVMWSAYYHTDLENEDQNLLAAAENDLGANYQYLRYWHGSIAIVRPLMTFLNLKQIYVLNGVFLIFFCIILLVILIRLKAYIPAFGITAGLILTSSWFVPFSLEYIWTYLLMLLISISGLLLVMKKRYQSIGILFLISGMVTNYLDFLTTETLTLTVPLLIVIWFLKRERAFKKEDYFIPLKSAAFWLSGYAGMWIGKWLAASLVLSRNVMPFVTEHIQERIGFKNGLGFIKFILLSIWRNIKCLFPLEYGLFGVILGALILLTFIYIGYVYRCKQIDKKTILIYAIVGIIPYIRFMVLCNHSYLHYFFTYRAQLAAILAITLILEELTKKKNYLKERRKI